MGMFKHNAHHIVVTSATRLNNTTFNVTTLGSTILD